MDSTRLVRTLILGGLIAASTLAGPAYAQVNINIGVAPPPPQYEVMPVMAPGYVWAPGYWAWHGDRHIWIRGRPIAQRTGYRWEPDRWEQRGNGYYRHEGRWERDGHKMMKEKHGNKHDR